MELSILTFLFDHEAQNAFAKRSTGWGAQVGSRALSSETHMGEVCVFYAVLA